MSETQVDFNSFFLKHRQWLVRQAYVLCKDLHEAEDLAQSTFVKVYVRWSTFDRHLELRGYLKKVLNSVFVDSRRRVSAGRETLAGVVAEGPASEPAESRAVEVRAAVFRLLLHLPLKQRQVIFLRFWADLDTAGTSRALGCTAGTVTSHTSRGLARLRVLIVDDPAAVM